MDKFLKVGIIGIGNMGSVHAQNIFDGKCPKIKLCALADNNPERIEWAKKQFGDSVAYFDNAEAMLDSGLIDSCVIAVPHYDHPKYTVECLKRSINPMTEKPAGVYTKQVREMNEEAAKHPETVFGMMFNQRTNCIYIKLRELVKSGNYGEIRRVNWIITNWYRPQAYYDSGSWRATWAGEGGGVLLNQCPHQLDLLQWICGMPSKIHAFMDYGKWHNIEVEDDVTAYLEYPNGATGVFVTTTGDAHGTNRLEIQMDRAKFVVENGKLIMEEYKVSEKEFSATNKEAFGVPESTVTEVETDGSNPQHVGVLNAWADAILDGGEIVAKGNEGINGLTLSNAMHLSAFTGKTIELPINEDEYYNELMKRVASSKKKDGVKTVFIDNTSSYGSV